MYSYHTYYVLTTPTMYSYHTYYVLLPHLLCTLTTPTMYPYHTYYVPISIDYWQALGEPFTSSLQLRQGQNFPVSFDGFIQSSAIRAPIILFIYLCLSILSKNHIQSLAAVSNGIDINGLLVYSTQLHS